MKHRAKQDRRFYTGMAVALLATAIVGFAPTFYFKGVSDTPPLPLRVHVHGLVFTCWLVLLVVQTGLVAAHRVAWHMRLGVGGALLALTMVPLGISTAIAAARRGITTPGLDPVELMIFPLGSILLFAAFAGLGIAKRKRPEVHRRLILLATISIIPPAIARMPVVGLRPVLALGLSLLFVAAGMLHDVRTRGRVHPAYVWGGLAILLSGPIRFGLSQTSAWHSVARFLMQ